MRRSKRINLRTDTKGYLLFEVLLSLVILSSGLILVSRSFLSSISALGVSKDHTRAVMVLEEKLAEVESGEIDIPIFSDVELEGEEAGYQWEIQSRRPEEEIGTTVPYTEVEVRVSWTARNREREVEASLGVSP